MKTGRRTLFSSKLRIDYAWPGHGGLKLFSWNATELMLAPSQCSRVYLEQNPSQTDRHPFQRSLLRPLLSLSKRLYRVPPEAK